MKWNKLKDFALIAKERFTGAEVNTTSVVIAYYLLLSIFPLLIAIGNLLPLLHLDVDALMDFLDIIVPAPLLPSVEPIMKSLLTGASGGLLSISALGTLWSASKGVGFLQRGMNKAYGLPNAGNFIVRRIISLVTIILLLAFFTVFVLVFSVGEVLLNTLAPLFTRAEGLLATFQSWKWPVALPFLFCIMLLIYRVTPDVKLKLSQVVPGAAFSTVGLMVLVQGFTFYLRFATSQFSSYGALGTFFVLMFWLNFSAMVIIVGAILNATLYEMKHGPAEEAYGRMDRAIASGLQSLWRKLQKLFQKRM